MRLLGLVILAIGAVIFAFGMSSTEAITDQVIEGISGRYSSHAVWYLLIGLVIALGGCALLIFGKNGQINNIK